MWVLFCVALPYGEDPAAKGDSWDYRTVTRVGKAGKKQDGVWEGRWRKDRAAKYKTHSGRNGADVQEKEREQRSGRMLNQQRKHRFALRCLPPGGQSQGPVVLGQSKAETCATAGEAKGWQGAMLLPPLQGTAEDCAGKGRGGVLPACQIVLLPVTLVTRSRIRMRFPPHPRAAGRVFVVLSTLEQD